MYLETLPAERLDQFIDSRRTMLQQAQRENVAQLYAMELVWMRHRRTMTWPGDMPELSLAKRAKHLACLRPWDDCATTIQPARRATVERIALVIGICIVVAIVVPMAVLAASARLRWALKVRLTNFLERERAREVYRTVYDFTTSISARLVTDAIEQRWGRTVPSGEAQFYVHSVIYEQQVILLLGNQDRPQIFAARIDFQSRDPASGTLWFFDTDGDDRIEAANQLRSGFNRLIKDLSPGSVLRERKEDVIIASWQPPEGETYQQRKPGQHRRRKDSAS